MTLQHNNNQGQIDALASIGIIHRNMEKTAMTKEAMEKEAMEKEAFLGTLKGLFQGGKSLLGKGMMNSVKGGGAIFPKSQAAIGRAGRSLNLSGTKNLTNLRNKGKAGLFGGKSTVNRSIGGDDLLSANKFKNYKTGPNLRRRDSRLYKAQIQKPKVPTVPRVDPGAPVIPPSPRSAGSTANLGNAPVNQGTTIGTGTTNTMPLSAADRQTRMQSRLQTQADARRTGNMNSTGKVGRKTPTTPVNAAGKTPTLPTDQTKTLEWMKENPILAGGGGLLGYKALTNNNSDNIVVGR